MPGCPTPYEYSSTKGIVFFAGKCIYEKGLFWLLLILSGAFFGRNFPSPGAQKWSLFASKNVAGALQIAIFPCRLLLRKMRPDPGPAGGRESYAPPGWHTHSRTLHTPQE